MRERERERESARDRDETRVWANDKGTANLYMVCARPAGKRDCLFVCLFVFFGEG